MPLTRACWDTLQSPEASYFRREPEMQEQKSRGWDKKMKTNRKRTRQSRITRVQAALMSISIQAIFSPHILVYFNYKNHYSSSEHCTAGFENC